MKNALCSFLRDESGATAIEYALIAGFIAVLIIAGATSIGVEVTDIFNDAAAGFTQGS